MSFLVGGEDSMTLEEVVAFIDSWDTGSSPADVTDNDSSPFSNEDGESVLLDSLDSVLEDASFLPKKESKPKPAKKKRKKAPGASTRLQRRKRAEILSLKAQSEQLEGRLNRLKRRSNVSLVQSGGSNSSWISWSTVAAAQYNQRLQSEMTNQKLRGVLAEQMKMNNALRDGFQMQASLGNLDVIFGKGPSIHQPVVDTSASMIGELENMVEGLYLDSAAVSQRKYTPSASTLRIIQEPTRGRVFEITASTSLQCSIQEASEMLWRDFLTVRKHNDKFYHFHRQRKPSSVEKKFTWVLRSDAKALDIDGFVFVRKIEEPNRIILVEAGRFLLPTGDLQFRIQRWTIITRSDDGPKSGSILRTLIQIHAENNSPDKKDIQDAEDLILGTLSDLMSFLPADEENMATLEELFAFIDCSAEGDKAGEGGSSQYFSEDSESPLILDSKADVGGAQAHIQPDTNALVSVKIPLKKTPKRRRIRIGWSSSTGLQRRKRAELEFLRQHVKDLEVFLQQLKASPRATFASIKTECPHQWKKVAMAEVVKLLRSEEVNRALKAIMNNQLQVHEGLRNVMEDNTSIYLPVACIEDGQVLLSKKLQ